jgi:hypothetical protein
MTWHYISGRPATNRRRPPILARSRPRDRERCRRWAKLRYYTPEYSAKKDALQTAAVRDADYFDKLREGELEIPTRSRTKPITVIGPERTSMDPAA